MFFGFLLGWVDSENFNHIEVHVHMLFFDVKGHSHDRCQHDIFCSFVFCWVGQFRKTSTTLKLICICYFLNVKGHNEDRCEHDIFSFFGLCWVGRFWQTSTTMKLMYIC